MWDEGVSAEQLYGTFQLRGTDALRRIYEAYGSGKSDQPPCVDRFSSHWKEKIARYVPAEDHYAYFQRAHIRAGKTSLNGHKSKRKYTRRAPLPEHMRPKQAATKQTTLAGFNVKGITIVLPDDETAVTLVRNGKTVLTVTV